MAIFLLEYQKYVKLNKDEIKAVYYLIKHRYLAGILWGIDGLVNRKNKKAKKLTYELVNKYKSFDKITLEEFLKVLS